MNRRKCIHVWRQKANSFRGLSSQSSAFLLLRVCSCFCCLYGGPAWRVASNDRFFFERLRRANRFRVDLPVGHCKQRNTTPFITTTSAPPPHAKYISRHALKGWEKKFHSHDLHLRLGHETLILIAVQPWCV